MVMLNVHIYNCCISISYNYRLFSFSCRQFLKPDSLQLTQLFPFNGFSRKDSPFSTQNVSIMSSIYAIVKQAFIFRLSAVSKQMVCVVDKLNCVKFGFEDQVSLLLPTTLPHKGIERW